MAKTVKDLRGLGAQIDGVPYPLKPVVWDMRLSNEQNVSYLEAWIGQCTKYLPAGHAFDEAAIMVPHDIARSRVLTSLEMLGWSVFNEAADLVYAGPIGTRYAVEYVFLRHPSKSYRIEVMLLGEPTVDGDTGFSPLHQSLWTPNGVTPQHIDHPEYPVPHLSFKPSPALVQEIGAGRAVRSVMRIMQEEMPIRRMTAIVQACQSTYGQFWYMAPIEGMGRRLYIKPRVNLRDGGEG